MHSKSLLDRGIMPDYKDCSLKVYLIEPHNHYPILVDSLLVTVALAVSVSIVNKLLQLEEVRQLYLPS